MSGLFYFLKQIHYFAGRKLYVIIIAMTFVSLLDGIGILLLLPMISMSGVIPFGTDYNGIIQMFSFLQDIPNELALPIILCFYLLIVILHNIIQRFITLQNAKIQQGFLRYLRIETYESLVHANWNFFIRNRKSDLINLLTTEIARTSSGTYSFLQFISSLIFTLLQVLLALWLSPLITFFVLCCGAFLLVLNRTFIKKSFSLGKRNYSLGQEYLAGLTDQINGIKDVKSNTLEASKMKWYRQITSQMHDEQVSYSTLKTTSQFYYHTACAIFIVVFIYSSVQIFHAQASQLMLIILIFSRLWPRVSGIQGSLEQIATIFPSFKAIKSLQEQSKLAKEFPEEVQNEVEPLTLKQDIVCENIFYRYYSSTEYALKNINIVIPAKRMTAIVGRSGAGKSTLIDLVMGLNRPEKGSILIDGEALSNEGIKSLRRAISYVPQDPYLFNTSIRENLTLVQAKTTEEKMWEALEFSSAAEFVRKLPQGLDTPIGDRGIRLSGGERQRIVLARAILREPSILVLDEATSALDTENETKIQLAIEKLKGRMTIIVIAHRLSTIRHADQIIVLNHGSIAQIGDYKQLKGDKKGIFEHLVSNQLEADFLKEADAY